MREVSALVAMMGNPGAAGASGSRFRSTHSDKHPSVSTLSSSVLSYSNIWYSLRRDSLMPVVTDGILFIALLWAARLPARISTEAGDGCLTERISRRRCHLPLAQKDGQRFMSACTTHE